MACAALTCALEEQARAHETAEERREDRDPAAVISPSAARLRNPLPAGLKHPSSRADEAAIRPARGGHHLGYSVPHPDPGDAMSTRHEIQYDETIIGPETYSEQTRLPRLEDLDGMEVRDRERRQDRQGR